MVVGMGGSETVAMEITGDASGLESAVANANNSLLGLKSTATKVGAAVSAAAIGSLGASAKAAADFDAAMTESTAIMGDLSDTMEKDMANAARRVARETTFSANQAAESYFFLASAGMDAADSMEALDDVAKFAQAGAMDMAEATDIATDAQSALGLTSENTEENISNLNSVMDNVVKANTLANATVGQFGESLQRVGGQMQAANMSMEEGTAILAALADQGMKGSRSGRMMNRMLEDMQKSAVENSEAWEELGVSVFDSEGNMRNMGDIIADLEVALGDMSTKQRRAALSQVGMSAQAARTTQMLLGSSDAIREYQSELENANGTTEEVAEKQLDTFNAQLSLLKSQVMDVAISIGSVLLPHLTSLVKSLSNVVTGFNDWMNEGNETIAALGLVGVAVAGLLPMIVSLGAAMSGLIGPISGASLIIGGLKAALVAVSLPISGLIIAIGALAAAFATNFAGIRDATTRVTSVLVEEFGMIGDAVKLLASNIMDDLDDLFGRTGDDWSNWSRSISDIMGNLKSNVEASVSGIVSVVSTQLIAGIRTAGQATRKVLFAMNTWWNQHDDQVVGTIASILAAVSQFASRVQNALGAAIQVTLSTVTALWRAHGDTVVAVISSIGTAIVSRYVMAAQMLRTALGGVVSFMTALWQRHRGVVIGAITAVAAVVGTLVAKYLSLSSTAQTVVGSVGRIGLALLGVLGPIGAVVAAVATLVQVWRTNFMGIRTTTIQVMQQVQTAIASAIPAIRSTIQSGLTQITSVFTSSGQSWRQTTQSSMLSIRTVITSALQAIRGVVNTTLSGIRAFWQQHGTAITNIVRTSLQIVVSVTQAMLGVLQSTVQSLLTNIKGLWDTHASGVEQVLRTFVTRVSQLFSQIFSMIIPAVQSGLNTIQSFWQSHGDTVMTIVQAAMDVVVTVITTALDVVVTTFRVTFTTINGLLKAFTQVLKGDWKGALNTMKSTASNVLGLIAGLFERTFNRIRNLANNLINTLVPIIRNGMNTIQNKVSSVLSSIASTVATKTSEMVSAFRDMVSSAVKEVRTGLSALSGIVSRKVNDAKSAITSKATAFKNAGKNLIQSVIDGVRDKIGDLGEAVGDAAQKAKDKWPFSDAKEGPLSNISEAGPAFIDTIASGIEKNVGQLEDASSLAAGELAMSPAPVTPPGRNDRGPGKVIRIRKIEVHADTRQGGREAVRGLRDEFHSGNL